MVASVPSSSCIQRCQSQKRGNIPTLCPILKADKTFPENPEEKSPHISLARSSNLPAKHDCQVDVSPRLSLSLFLHPSSCLGDFEQAPGMQFIGFEYIHRVVQSSPLSNYRTYSLPPTKPCVHYQSIPSPPPSSPWQLLIYILSLQICPFGNISCK